jgi:xanthine dehydrogenase YagS FAD-binding subunit
MNPFRYQHAERADAAIALAAAAPDSAFFAGGTTVIDLLKNDVERHDLLVDINALPLARIESTVTGGLRIGAMVRNSDLAYHPDVRARYPMLSEAILSGASPQLRNMATTGGNILQRTRCHYFRDLAMPCNKRATGSGCSALEGYNRMHAVLGTSAQCIATHASDMCVALVALDALVRTQGPAGERLIPLIDFHLVPGDTPQREHVLEHGELITAIDLPDVPFARRSRYLKVRDRSSYEFALVSAAVALDLQGGTVRDVRIALGGVGTKPWRSPEAERVLRGRSADRASFRAAAEAALAGARPYAHNGFKIELARRTLVRVLSDLAAQGPERQA